MTQYKQTIVLDFDGTIHSYTSGWKGATVIPDPPTKGAKEAIAKLRETYIVVVCSSRCSEQGAVKAIYDWLDLHDIKVDLVSALKPPHLVVVDDRALRFEGDWDKILANIKDASIPWNKRDSG